MASGRTTEALRLKVLSDLPVQGLTVRKRQSLRLPPRISDAGSILTFQSPIPSETDPPFILS